MSEKECRICYDTNKKKDFISPCFCDGTRKHVHKKCLQQWRNIHEPDHISFTHCDECQYEYNLDYDLPLETYTLYNFTVKDFIIEYTFVQAFILLFTSISIYVKIDIFNNKQYLFLNTYNFVSLCYLQLLFFSYFFSSLYRVNNTKKYFKLTATNYFFTYLFCIHYFWIYVFWGYLFNNFLLYTIFESFVSIFQYLIILIITKFHKKAIKNINKTNNLSVQNMITLN